MRSHVDYLLNVSGIIGPNTRARRNAYRGKHPVSCLCLLAERRDYPVGFTLGGGYLGSGTQLKLLQDLANVVCCRVLGDGELFCYLAVG